MLQTPRQPVASTVLDRFGRMERVVQGAHVTQGARLGRELRWCRWLTLMIVLLDIVLTRVSPNFPWLPWEGWLAAISIVVCWWSPLVGVPACALTVLVSDDAVPANCIDLVVMVAPFASVFFRNRWLIVLGLWCFLFPAALQASQGEFPGFALLGAVSLAAGMVTYRAWQFSLGDDGAVLGLIQEQLRIRADERRILARELDELISDRLSSVVGSLERDLDRAEPAALREVVELVSSAAHQMLSLLRQAISVLRDSPAMASVKPVGTRIRPAEYMEENLVAHGHPVELNLVNGAELEIEQSPITGHVLSAVLQAILEEIPAGESCQISARSTADGIELDIAHETVPESTLRQLDASISPIQILADFIKVEQGNDMVRWRIRLASGLSPNKGAAADDIDSPWRRALMTRSTPSMFSAFLVGVWMLSLLWYLYRTPTEELFSIEILVVTGAYLVAVLFVLMPRWYPVLLVASAGIIIISSWNSWHVGHAFVSLFCAGLVAFVWRKWIRLWALVFFAALCWQALLHKSTFWLVSGVAMALLFVAAGLLVGYFLERRERLLIEMEKQQLRLADARAAERRALAGELHDVVAHQLSLITMQAGLLRQESDTAVLRSGFRRLAELARRAGAELVALKQVLAEGDPSAEGKLGSIVDAVRDAKASLAESSLDLHIEMEPNIDEVDPMVRHTMVRLLRECETNMLRYAPKGAKCQILIWRSDERMRVRASNSLAAERQTSSLSNGLGLRGLAERVDLMGGSFSAGVIKDEWVVDVSLPEEQELTPFAVR